MFDIQAIYDHCYCLLAVYSTAICKLGYLIPPLHQSDWRIPNQVNAKTAYF